MVEIECQVRLSSGDREYIIAQKTEKILLKMGYIAWGRIVVVVAWKKKLYHLLDITVCRCSPIVLWSSPPLPAR